MSIVSSYDIAIVPLLSSKTFQHIFSILLHWLQKATTRRLIYQSLPFSDNSNTKRPCRRSSEQNDVLAFELFSPSRVCGSCELCWSGSTSSWPPHRMGVRSGPVVSQYVRVLFVQNLICQISPSSSCKCYHVAIWQSHKILH